MSTIPDSNQFNVNLKAFNGPLDVLLDLAKSQKLNLEDISQPCHHRINYYNIRPPKLLHNFKYEFISTEEN